MLDLRSPYFDSALVYFTASEDSNHQYQWKETRLDPRLYAKWDNCEGYDISYDLKTHLVFSNPEKNPSRIFVGVPREKFLRDTVQPNGYFISKQIRKTRKPGIVEQGQIVMNMDSQTQPCEWVTRTFSIPQECPTLKSLFVVDLYMSTQWENINNFNPKSKRYARDSRLLGKSSVYAINASGDTTALNEDFGYWYGWIDGGGEMYGAYTLAPHFADLNGDGRFDMFQEFLDVPTGPLPTAISYVTTSREQGIAMVFPENLIDLLVTPTSRRRNSWVSLHGFHFRKIGTFGLPHAFPA